MQRGLVLPNEVGMMFDWTGLPGGAGYSAVTCPEDWVLNYIATKTHQAATDNHLALRNVPNQIR